MASTCSSGSTSISPQNSRQQLHVSLLGFDVDLAPEQPAAAPRVEERAQVLQVDDDRRLVLDGVAAELDVRGDRPALAVVRADVAGAVGEELRGIPPRVVPAELHALRL